MVGHADAVTVVAAAQCTMHISSSNSAINNLTRKWVVISGSRDNQLIVWDASTGSELHTLKGHRDAITCLRVTSDGSVAISGTSFFVVVDIICMRFQFCNRIERQH